MSNTEFDKKIKQVALELSFDIIRARSEWYLTSTMTWNQSIEGGLGHRVYRPKEQQK